MRRLILAGLLLATPSTVLAQLHYWPPQGAAGGGTWGTITGTLADQTDLGTALAGKCSLGGCTMTGAVLGVTTCTTPQYSFTGSASSGMCHPTSGVTVQVVDGTTDNSKLKLHIGSARLEFYDATALDGTLLFSNNDFQVSVGAVLMIQGSPTAVAFGNTTTHDRLVMLPVAKGTAAFDGTITPADLTAARTWTLPNSSGTVLFSPGAGFPADTDGAGTMAARTIAAGTGISIANGAGAAGNPTVSIDTAIIPQFSSGTGDVPATGALGTFYLETDKPAGYFYPATDTEHWILSVPPASVAQGDVFYASGAHTLARLGAGTSGQFLQTQGAAANPQWATQTDFDPGTTINFFDEMSYTSWATIPAEWVEVAFGGNPSSEAVGCPSGSLAAGCVFFTNPAVDNGGSAYRTGSVSDVTSGEWQIDARFQLSSVTSMAVWVGFLFHSTAGSRTPLLASDAVWVRFDTDASDTNYTFQVCDAAGAAGCQASGDDTDSAVVAGTIAATASAWTRARIRMDQTGVGGAPTIYFRVNAEAEKTFCASGCDDVIADMPAAANDMYPFVSCGTRDGTGAEICYYDYFKLSGTR